MKPMKLNMTLRDSSFRPLRFTASASASALCVFVSLLVDSVPSAAAFASSPLASTPAPPLRTSTHARIAPLHAAANADESAQDEAERLLAKARAIRESLPPEAEGTSTASPSPEDGDDERGPVSSPSAGYRLYVDIGREDGTWMDPRWGASGARIEFTVDVDFLTPPVSGDTGAEQDASLAAKDVCDRMVKDNFGGRSSPVRVVRSSPNARLRGGFDRMACRGGGYRVDVGGRGGDAVVRFHLDVDGTPSGPDSTYGDLCVPEGCLHFSIPCFGGSVGNLSSREGPVTVRQVGWHTGWRREESRIVGTFRAKPIEEARRKDGY